MEVLNVVMGVCMDGLRPDIPLDCPETLRDLMGACWQKDPLLRPDFADILSRLTNYHTLLQQETT